MISPVFDIRSLMVMSALSALVVGVGFLLARDTLPARMRFVVSCWGLAELLSPVGLILISERGQISDLWSIVLANTVLAASLALRVEALRDLFAQQRRSRRHLLIVPAVALAALALTSVWPNAALRTAAVLGLFALQMLIALRLMLIAPRSSRLTRGWELLIALLGIGAVLVMTRAGIALASLSRDYVPFADGALAAASIAYEGLLSLLGSLALLMIASSVVLSRLALANRHLKLALSAAGMRAWVAHPMMDALTEDNNGGVPVEPLADLLPRVHPDDRIALEALFESSGRESESSVLELRICDAEGRLRWHRVAGQADRQQLDRGERLLIGRDIDDEKRAALAAATLSRQLGTAVAAAGMVTFESVEHTEWIELHGDVEQLFGMPIRAWSDLRGLVDVDDREHFDQEVTLAIALHGVRRIEYRIRRRDGSMRNVLMQCGQVEPGPGELLRLAGVLQDVTSLRATEAALRQSQHHLRRALDSAGMVLWEWDLRNQVRTSYGDDIAIYGCRPDTHEKVNALIHPDDRERTDSLFEQAIANGGEYLSEFRISRPDGQQRWIYSHGHAERGADGVVERVSGVAWDITQRRQVEEELRATQERLTQAVIGERAASDAKSRFLATMSHEIRTPLNGVIGSAQLLARAPLGMAEAALVRTLTQSGEFLLAIINDILDFSKVEAGELTLETIPLALGDCLEAATQMQANAARDRGLTLAAVAHGAWRRRVRGDPVRLQQVLVNLISNAVKFTERGGVRVDLAVEDGARAGIRFSISDSGEGMSEETRQRLFQPFQQGDVSTTRRHGGSGLGLAICDRLMRKMNGSIEVESTVGVGSTFEVRLALDWVDDAVPPRPQRNLRYAAMLVAVAEPIAQAALVELLEQCGVHVVLPVEARGSDWQAVVVDAEGWRQFGMEAVLGHRRREVRTIALLEVDGTGKAHDYWLPPGYIRFDPPLTPATVDKLVAVPPEVASESATPAASPESTIVDPIGDREVLVVEDNPVNQTILQMMLESMGFSPDFADNGREAVERALAHRYDLILMDVEMPVMDGMEAARAIRAYSNDDIRPWIIGVSAHVFDDQRDEIMAAGMNDFVAKPVRLPELTAALQRGLATADQGAPALTDSSM